MPYNLTDLPTDAERIHHEMAFWKARNYQDIFFDVNSRSLDALEFRIAMLKENHDPRDHRPEKIHRWEIYASCYELSTRKVLTPDQQSLVNEWRRRITMVKQWKIDHILPLGYIEFFFID